MLLGERDASIAYPANSQLEMEEQRASDPALFKGPFIPTSYFMNKTQQVGKIHGSNISILLSLVMTSLEIKKKNPKDNAPILSIFLNLIFSISCHNAFISQPFCTHSGMTSTSVKTSDESKALLSGQPSVLY